MRVENLNLEGKIIDLKLVDLNFSIIYEIIKKYVANVKLENM